MAFAAGAYRSSPGRGGASPGFRFTLYAILAVVLMFVDQRRHWLVEARYVLSGAAYPLQLAVSSPTAAWRWIEESAATRDALRAENARLRQRDQLLEMKTQRFEALSRENGELRGLRDALPPVADHWLIGEVVNVEMNSLRQRVLIDRGARNGVFKGQAVMDSHGLLGQTMHVGPWSAEVILVTDPEHAVPVEIERTGVRTIAVGAGDTQSLALPYLPANADVKPGDLLVTSGLGGVFPQGYPVARVIEVRHDAVQPLAQIRARPLAQLDRLHEVMLVWFKPDHPAAPTRPSSTVDGNLPSGNPAFQPQAVPPRPAAAAAAPSAVEHAEAARASGAAAHVQAAGSPPGSHPADAHPAEAHPADAHPAEAHPAEARSAGTHPTDVRSGRAPTAGAHPPTAHPTTRQEESHNGGDHAPNGGNPSSSTRHATEAPEAPTPSAAPAAAPENGR